VEACHVLGYGHARILFRHVLPNVLGTVIIYITLTIPGVMLLEAFLSFLGLGVQAPMSSWGSLIKDGVGAMEDSPWQLLVPAGSLFVTLLSLNFLGDGLRDALDPRRATQEPPREPAESEDDGLLVVEGLSVTFPTREGEIEAVRHAAFTLQPGETLGIVGESGSGKSVSVSSLMGLVPTPPARISGTARFHGRDLLTASSKELRRIRGDRIAMIFQDPMTSLNPHQRIIDQVAEPLRIHRGLPRTVARFRAIDALEAVGIPDAARRAYSWPHEFSGGMRQRVMIAMAMITEPEILIADEPTTALDVTVQRQILELISKLQREHGTSVILISHDLAVVSKVCSRILVMRDGRVVEQGDTETLMNAPGHPYTRGLLKCHPALHAPGTRLSTLEELMRAEEQPA
jgi:peptide/nickel transport system permease protein